jgi:isoleucyl-tRNA synthetase
VCALAAYSQCRLTHHAQWFVDLSGLQSSAAAALESVDMVPAAARLRMMGYLATRSRWCISRQRPWGVPIPALRNSQTGEVLLTPAMVESFASIVRAHKHGSQAWWDLDPRKWAVELGISPSLAEADQWVKFTDTLDVWFDSGSSWSAVIDGAEYTSPAAAVLPSSAATAHDGDVPVSAPVVADVYLEGSDQHRGWFQSSLLTSVAVRGIAPYKSVVTHGFVMDASGRKMSKSLGNVVSPSHLIEGLPGVQGWPGYGVDVARYWVCSADWSHDVTVSPELLAACSDGLRRLRNACRFALGALSDFTPGGCAVSLQGMRRLDKCVRLSLPAHCIACCDDFIQIRDATHD